MTTSGKRQRAPLQIALEGVIGAGKTTLARALAEHIGAVRLFEDDITNPYLDDFYRHGARYALPCQLAFLAGRVEQFTRPLPVGVPVVADHSLVKEAIFAGANLEGRDWELYQRLQSQLCQRGRINFVPRVVIYLSASLDEVRRRIRARGRRREYDLELSYLKRLVEAYQDWCELQDSTGDSRVVVVNADGIGLASDRQALTSLIDACRQARPGIQYCNPRALTDGS